jgi:hypothetical protein
MAKKNISVEELMMSATGGKASKSKSKIPIHDVQELVYDEVETGSNGKPVLDEKGFAKVKKCDYISRWVEASAAIKTNESIKTECERMILPIAEILRRQDSKDKNEFLSSTKIRVEPNTLTYTQTAQFSAIDQEHKQTIVDTCEEEGVEYKEYFEPVPFVSLKSDLPNNKKDEVIMTLFKTFGEEFKEIFDLGYPIKIKAEQFSRDLVFKAKAAAIFEKLGPNGENIVKMKKASVKIS